MVDDDFDIPLPGMGLPSIDELAKSHPKLAKQLKSYNSIGAASTFAGMLLAPELQSNCIRLEALIHLALALGEGKAKPLAKQAAEWFADLGDGHCGRAEDPAEDLFVRLVTTSSGNYRVFDGIWESGSFYLQLFSDVVERMPRAGPFARIKAGVENLLTLSDALCDRAELQRYCLGSTERHTTLPAKIAHSCEAMRRRVRFSKIDLDNLGVELDALNVFLFPHDRRHDLLEQNEGHTLLERRPLIWDGEYLHFLLPTAISAAVRRYVLEEVFRLGVRDQYDHAVTNEYTSRVFETPLLGKMITPAMRFQKRHGAFMTCPRTFIQP